MPPIVPPIAVARRSILPLVARMPFATMPFATMSFATMAVAAMMALTAAAATRMAAFAGRRTVGRVRRCLTGF